jgi:hypothetical protein
VRLDGIDKDSLDTPLQKRIYEEVGEILTNLGSLLEDNTCDEDSGWLHAYKAELLMGQLLNGERLKQEIEARLGEIVAFPGAKHLQDEYKNLNTALGPEAANADSVRRDFLVRMLESLQWFYRTQHVARPFYIRAIKANLRLLLLAMVLVVAHTLPSHSPT